MARARRTIKNAKRKKYKNGRSSATGLAQAFRKKFKMRSNPSKAVIDALKGALPIGVGFFGGRYAIGKVVPHISKVPVIGKYSKYHGVLASLGLMVGVAYASKSVSALKKHREKLMWGLALASIEQVAKATGIAGYLGMGEYLQMGEYIQTGEYIAQDEYYSELGEFYAEMGDNAGKYPSQLAPIPDVPALKAIPEVSMVQPVQPWGADSDLYQGVFAQSML